MSQHVSADVSFQCDKADVFGDKIKGTFSV